MAEKASSQRRVLAAIVFTDVVSFSKLMSLDENKAMRLVERDFNMMGRACEAFDGQILKNTGDGLLMYFSSAVQAVSCALRIQQSLAREEANLAPGDVLKHRIGIHLGDVFVSDNDVMGDGVNIAARLQKTAEPGGICVSQTVYDVVKNRLELQTTFLGPQELRNIQGKVGVYRILLDASAATAGGAVAVKPAGLPVWRQKWFAPTMAGVAAGLILLVVLLALILGGGSDEPALAQNPSTPPVQIAAPQTPASPAANDPERSRPMPGVMPRLTGEVDPDRRTRPQMLNREPEPPSLDPDGQAEPAERPGPDGQQAGRLPRPRRDDESAGQPPRPGPDGSPPDATRVFRHLDRNQDGKISRDEIPEREKTRMMQADANNDGEITLEELKAHHEKIRSGEFRPPPPDDQNNPGGNNDWGPPPGPQ